MPPVSSVIAKIVADRLLPAAARFSRSFDRLVHFSVKSAEERLRQSRLLAGLMVAPFILSPAFAASVAQGSSIQEVTVLCGVAFCGFWTCAIAQSLSGRHNLGLVSGLAMFSLMIGIAMALSGGLASPLALLLAIPFLETRWIGRTRGDLKLAGAASLSAAIVAMIVQQTGDFAGGPSISQWIAPLLYGMTLGGRFIRGGKGHVAPTVDVDQVEEVKPALELSSQGDVLEERGECEGAAGFPAEGLMGRGLFERLHVADRVVFLKAVSDVHLDGETRPLELRVHSFDGTFHTLACDLGRDANGRLWLEFAAVDAIARQVDIEDGEGGRNSAQNRFLATVSHELRTPLNAIIGMSDMLAHEICGPLSNERQREYVSLIRQSGDHLLSVVNTVLEVSKVEFGAYSLKAEPFAFADVAEFCARMLETEAGKKNVHITLDLAADLPQLEADRRAVQQVLINLACNAVKFCRQNGHVTIAARASGSHLVIRISDDGIGIPADRIAELGQPFTQVHSNDMREGSGLGLALVKGLVGLHKGTVTIDSVVDQGTTVTVTLPLEVATERPMVSQAQTNEMQEETHGSLRKAG
ncbi:sensor histidine kinase [Limoniibacter endophyticus]|uniref:histidine kinase n=1 Tax=Limoniibacter endophyticus TaxID=1565040 RepID=A0A8J3GI15_9HYPH|nr:HAMP domain-containing sensor histidine kinase [Limoniibacter endophyticus]GHC69449.1 ATPase [Limoniibacter endophyticus]